MHSILMCLFPARMATASPAMERLAALWTAPKMHLKTVKYFPKYQFDPFQRCLYFLAHINQNLSKLKGWDGVGQITSHLIWKDIE